MRQGLLGYDYIEKEIIPEVPSVVEKPKLIGIELIQHEIEVLQHDLDITFKGEKNGDKIRN